MIVQLNNHYTHIRSDVYGSAIALLDTGVCFVGGGENVRRFEIHRTDEDKEVTQTLLRLLDRHALEELFATTHEGFTSNQNGELQRRIQSKTRHIVRKTLDEYKNKGKEMINGGILNNESNEARIDSATRVALKQRLK